MKVDTAKAALPGARTPLGLPVFARDGEILPPVARPGTTKGKKR
jgi:hypothetical protein